jgi:tyrosyl-tRNA synthetase
MNTMLPGLTGGKMSSSEPDSKIDFLDPPEAIKRKIKKAFCEEGNVEENGILAFIEHVLIPVSQLRLHNLAANPNIPENERKLPFASPGAPEGTLFSVERPEKYGGPVHYSSYPPLREDFKNKAIHPGDLKGAATTALTSLLAPIRAAYEANPEWQACVNLAYPDPSAAPEKKKKKVCCAS